MLAPESELSYARLALFQKYNWTTVTIVQASQHLFSAVCLWMDGWTGGLVDGWMGAWMDEWMDGGWLGRNIDGWLVGRLVDV